MKSVYNAFKLHRLIEKEKRFEKRNKSTAWCLRCLRLFIHIFICLALLAAAFFSKLSLLTMAYQIGNENNTRDRELWVWTLLFAVTLPILLAFFNCLFKALMRRKPTPNKRTILLSIVLETANAVGLGVFVFGVLSQLDLIRVILLMNTLSLWPSIMQLFHQQVSEPLNFHNSELGFLHRLLRSEMFARLKFEMNKHHSTLTFMTKCVAVIMQLSMLPVVLLSQFESTSSRWQIPVAILLLSFSIIKSFVSFSVDMMPCAGRFLTEVNDTARMVIRCRHKLGLFTHLWRIGIVLLISHLYFPNYLRNTGLFTVHRVALNATENTSYPSSVSVFMKPLGVHLGSSFACYLCAHLAFRLRMHRVAFALPMLLVTPFCLTVVLILCNVPTKFNFNWQVASQLDYSLRWQIVVGMVVWWLSHLWTTRHMWRRHVDRKNTRPSHFINFCSVFVDNTLMLNEATFRFDSRHQVGDEAIDGSVSSGSVITCTSSSQSSISSLSMTRSVSTSSSPVLFICATMWHENAHEMLQLLKSIMRIDIDQSAKLRGTMHRSSHDYVYEAHIFFDDAISNNEPNEFVQILVSVVNEAAEFAYKRAVQVTKATKTLTPYGGRLTFNLPSGNLLVVHLKDKTKIRIKKRWSQVMYMYYLLGYKYFGDLDIMESFYANKRDSDSDATSGLKASEPTKQFRGFGNLMRNIDPLLRNKIENTFILTLDGDVEFRPDAIQLMLDKIIDNKKIGSVCGRVHPIGSGPLVWYQMFEYAIGHWLQKVTEHIFGTVMCSPGCFTILRGSTLLEDYVLPIYSHLATEAKHHIQYDQGEDRWLSTLIIQQGYYSVYCSAATCRTYAPETFEEYFNQRRRWIPSTLANIIDFIKDYKHILRVNERITIFYVFYTVLNLIASLLGPSTVLLMIADTFQNSFELNASVSYILAVAPAIIFIVASFFLSSKTQIRLAALLSAIFAFIMVIIIIGAIARMSNTSYLNPSSVLFFLLVVIFTTSALIHPHEFGCLSAGIIYFLCLPSSFVLLNIFALYNLNSIAWGTREKKPDDSSDAASVAKNDNLWRRLMPNKRRIEDSRVDKIMETLRIIETKMEPQNESKKTFEVTSIERTKKSDDDEVRLVSSRAWMSHPSLDDFTEASLDGDEWHFFAALISRYLTPLTQNNTPRLRADLASLRNNCCFLVLMFNAIWYVIIFTLQLLQNKFKDKVYLRMGSLEDGNAGVYEPISFLFIMLFAIVLCLQFIAMLWHRTKTLMHLITKTSIRTKYHRSLVTKSIVIPVKETKEINIDLTKTIDEEIDIHNIPKPEKPLHNF